MQFLFWNLHSANPKSDKERQQENTRVNNLCNALEYLVRSNSVETVLLCDFNIEKDVLLTTLQKADSAFKPVPSSTDHVTLFTSQPLRYFKLIKTDAKSEYKGKRISVWRIKLPLQQEVLLVGIHLVSKREYIAIDQEAEARKIVRELVRIETGRNHERTIIAGDFNMNPFETGMTLSDCFNSISSWRVVKHKQRRTIQNDSRCTLFYNAGWSFLGDNTRSVGGTYHDDRTAHNCYYWNVFDQVLLRPDLIDADSEPRIHIVEGYEDQIFVSGPYNAPDAKNWSDHLPLLFDVPIPDIQPLNET